MEEKTIKIGWDSFKRLAYKELLDIHPTMQVTEAKFMRIGNYERDAECYELPHYVEIPLS